MTRPKLRSGSRDRSGFTLIELLVTIAIIVTLAALLSGVAKTAIEASRRAACLSNLKQISVKLNVYRADNGKFPLGVPAAGWPIGRFNTAQMGFRALEEAGLVDNSKIFFCPSGTLKPDPWWNAWGPNDKYSGYCFWFNYAYDNPGVATSDNLARSELVTGSKTIIASDIIGKDPAGTGMLNHVDSAGKCAGGNILYGDGHAAWFPMAACKPAAQNGFDFWLP